MSDYVEGLARRGAGLPPPAGTAVAQARPQGRFEAAAPDFVEAEAIVPSVAPSARGIADAPPPPATEWAEAPPAGASAAPLGPAKPLAKHGSAEHEFTEPTSQAARPSDQNSPGSPIGVEGDAPSLPGDPIEIVARGQASASAPPAAERIESGAAVVPQRGSGAPPVESPTAREQATPQRENVVVTESVAQPEHSRFELLAPWREREAAETPGPTVTVSIGRIDVEVAPPPVPNAPRARFEPVRTRGFADYARARRGHPR